MPHFILGSGSNVLFDDSGFNGLVIQTGKLDRSLTDDGNTISVGASVRVIEVLRYCMLKGFSGLECLVGIPGNMGGVFFMNAGTTIGEIKDVLIELTAFDLKIGSQCRVILQQEMVYGYRSQLFLNPNEIIVQGKIRISPGQPSVVQQEIRKLLEKRSCSQPIDRPSCGSVFKNPDLSKGIHAWKLIDGAGLRGYRIGDAQISELHTNFIVNLGSARAKDVRALITEAKTRVLSRFGVQLEEEVRIIENPTVSEEKRT